jgi:hypothetical protein
VTQAGDTAESYAKEWENLECLKLLQEATQAGYIFFIVVIR